ncbi:MAG: hypothetical protein EOP91_08000 [Lysobacteraceae bacterium]|nr:MAG: hypothetical protein EOP91_08000 [Xanthomonadaceae bacterium]
MSTPLGRHRGNAGRRWRGFCPNRPCRPTCCRSRRRRPNCRQRIRDNLRLFPFPPGRHMAATPPPMPIARNGGWWQRHWRWAVPALAALGLGLFAAFLLLILSAIFGMMKSSDAYRQAMSRLHASPAATAALGAPLREGWLTLGNIEVNGPSGEASLQIPVSGSLGEGDLYVEAEKAAGAWTFHTLVLQLDADGRRIDLLEEAQPAR